MTTENSLSEYELNFIYEAGLWVFENEAISLDAIEWFRSMVDVKLDSKKEENMSAETSVYLAAKKYIQAVDKALAEKNDFDFMKYLHVVVEAENELIDQCKISEKLTRAATIENLS